MLTREHSKIINKSLRDPLTGVYNRRALEDELVKMQKYQLAYHPPCFSILLMDIDKFKQINDQYGHDIGDLALTALASLTNSMIRSNDIFGRYGGEEFLLLFPATIKKDANALAERIRQAIESTHIALPADGGHIRMTVSIGISNYPGDSSKVEDAIKVADKAMYQAKESGRNRVICA